jgi:CRP/FNR family transcriptional regulator
MISQAEFTELLPLYPALGDLAPALRWSIVRDSCRLNLQAGETVFDVGSRCSFYPLLASGSIRVTKSLADGREIVVYRLLPGQSCLLTTSCLLGDHSYPARGLVEKDLRGVLISKLMFERLVESSRPFREFVFHSFADRVLQLMEFIELVGFGQLDQRVAHSLRDMPKVIQTTHQQLAEEVGSVREVVSRVLKRLEDQGVLALARGRITIVDREALNRIAQPYSDTSH